MKTDSRKFGSGVSNVVLLGLVSCFADISSEMVYPLIPLYLTAAFGATPVLVGIVEGIAESVSSLLKVFGGYLTDRFGHKKRVAWLGYSTGLLYKIALLAAGSWGGVLAARVVDRIGKGIRTAPRDTLVSESSERNRLGRSFGIHKALDMAGSAVGILLAFLLMGSGSDYDFKGIFAWSMIPVAIALLLMLSVKERQTPRNDAPRERFWSSWRGLDRNLKLYLAVSFIFTLGNSSNAFLLLRAKDIGFDDRSVVLLYLVYNIVAAVGSIPCGRLSDRIGRKRLLVGGYLLFTAVYIGFAFVSSQWFMVTIFALYGLYTAMVAGVERAFIAEISPAHLRGTMLGLQSTLVGVALMPASIVAGVLWNSFGASAPFLFGGAMSLAAAIILLTLLGRTSKIQNA